MVRWPRFGVLLLLALLPATAEASVVSAGLPPAPPPASSQARLNLATAIDVAASTTRHSATSTIAAGASFDDGPGNAWSDPGYILASDDAHAEVSAHPSDPSDSLHSTGLGFSIPEDATIGGIEVAVERHTDGSGAGVKDSRVQLLKSGSRAGDNRGDQSTRWPISDAVKTYGGPGDLWGVSWTPADMNADDFGVALSIAAGSGTAYVDQVRIVVHYTLPVSLPVSPTGDGPSLASFTPGQETRLKSGDGRVVVTVPGDAFSESASIEYSPQAPFVSTAVKVFRQFDLRARAATDRTRLIEQFDAPVTVTLHYDPADVRGLDNRTYRLAYFNPGTGHWEDLETTHDVENRTLTARTDHFSIFGAQANPAYAIQGMVQDFQADIHSGGAVFQYPIELPPVPGGRLPGLSLTYDSGRVNETKNHRDVGSWAGIGWDLSLPHIFYNEESGKFFLSLNGLQTELVRGADSVWYTNPDFNLKIEPSTPVTATTTESAGAGANGTLGGTTNWTNPGNITASDNVRAAWQGIVTGTSQQLNATNFGFNIPGSATVSGIEVTIERLADQDNGEYNYFHDEHLYLLKAGATAGSDRADTATHWPTTEGIKTYGGPSDLWGTSWTPADINASNFGVSLQVRSETATSWSYVDHVQIRVYYADPSNFSANQSWTVWTRDGTRYDFGGALGWNQYRRNPDPKTWRFDLASVTDVHGNAATTTFARYETSTGSDSIQAAHPAGVTYYASGTTTLFQVVFDRADGASDRPDLPTGTADNPQPLVMDRARLSSIEVKVATSTVRLYEFAYGSATTTSCTYGSPTKTIYYAGHLWPTSLTHKGSDGSTIVDTLTFDYGPGYRQIRYPGAGVSPLPCTSDPPGEERHTDARELYHPFLESVTNRFGGSVSFVHAQKTAVPSATSTLESAGTGSNYDDDGLGNAWSTPGNIVSSDDTHAQVVTHASYASDFLYATNFGFAVPAATTISGIEVIVERKASSPGVKDYAVELLKAGARAGEDKRDTVNNWPTTDTTRTYGGPTDLWGLSWTPADINASNFGFSLAIGAAAGGITAYVDHIEIRVHHDPDFWGRQTVTSRAISPGAGVDGVTATTTYAYSADPEYYIPPGKNPFDGEFRGFRQVTVTRGDDTSEKHYFYTTGTTTVSHPVSGSVSRDGDRLKGREYRVEVFDASNRIIQRSFTDWNYSWVSEPADIYEVRAENGGLEVFDPTGTSVRRKHWTYLTYDAYGNVTKQEEHGDYGASGDERTTHRGFTPNTTAWVVDRPYFERSYTGIVGADDPTSSNLRSQTKFYYDGQGYGTAPIKGDLTKVERYASK